MANFGEGDSELGISTELPAGAAAYGCGLWLEIIANSNAIATLTLHNIRPGGGYQVFTNSDLNLTNWSLFLTNIADGSGFLTWTNIAINLQTNLFFRACEQRDYVTNLVFQGITITNFLKEPPDSMGAVGPNHFVELINNYIAVYDKLGNPISETHATNFFAVFDDTGTNLLTGDLLIDPRILYDAEVDRWVACAIDAVHSDKVVIAVTTNGNPTNLTTGWTKHILNVKRSNVDTDFTTMGMDSNGIYVRVAHRNGTNAGHTIVAIRKPDIYLNPPITNFVYVEVTNDIPVYTIQPAVNFDPVPTNGYAWLFAKGPPDLSTNYKGGDILYRRIQWLDTNRVNIDSNWIAVANPGGDYRNYYDLDGTNTTTLPVEGGVLGPVLGGNIHLFEVGSRLASVSIRNGFLWTCQTIGLAGTNGIYVGDKSGTNVDRSAIQWFRAEIAPDGSAITLREHGRVFDSVQSTNAWWYHYGSLAVNCPGDMIIGFSGSSVSNYIGAFYTSKLADETLSGSIRTIQMGTSAHSGGWGDYSATHQDPVDQWSFWTVQAYSTPFMVFAQHWTTVIAEIKAKP